MKVQHLISAAILDDNTHQLDLEIPADRILVETNQYLGPMS